MRIAIPSVVLLVLTATASLAEPPLKYADWATGPVSHMLTASEKAQWKDITSEKQAEEFIALFWAKRDPTAGTSVNELREEFDRRVELADTHFTTKRTRGAMSDRGRALILLGTPFDVGSKGATGRARANANISRGDQWDGSVIGPRGESPRIVWTYAHEKRPKYVNRKSFELHFVDDQGDGQFAIAKTNIDPEAIFLEAIQGLIFAPELTTAPVYDVPAAASIAPSTFRNAGLKQAADQFRAAGKPSEGPALLTWSQFVTPEGEIFVPVQLFLPGGSGIDAGRKLTFFGVVENEAGQIVSTHEDEITLAASGRDAYVDKSLLLTPGNYKATFGLADAGKVLSLAATDMKVVPLDPNESGISDLILSNNTYPLSQAQSLTDPFAFGGLKVVPKTDALFQPSDDIWYFHELRNPGLTESGNPKVQAKILIEGTTVQDKPVKMNFPVQEFEAIPLKGVKNHYGLAMSIPLKDFQPGKYMVKIKVIDTVLKKSYESEKHFEVKL